MHIMKCISRRQEIMREEVFHRRNLINRRQLDGGGNGGFGKKAATAVALAVIFGLVAGAVFQGVNIAADKYRDNNSSSTQIGKTETC